MAADPQASGPIANRVAGEMRLLARAPGAIPAAAIEAGGSAAETLPALPGGQDNVLELTIAANRLRAHVRSMAEVDRTALDEQAARGWREVSPNVIHALL